MEKLAVLIVTRFSDRRLDFSEVRKEILDKMVLVTNKNVFDNHQRNFDYIIVSNQYSNDYSVEMKIHELNEKFNFTKLICFEETDILRAAIIRDRLGIEGLNYETSLLYRDKYLMKKKVSESGIKCPNFRPIENTFDLLDFVKDNGYPIFLKPRSEMIGIGTKQINNSKELESWLRNNSPTNYLAEEFIDAPVYHTNGIFNKGEIHCFSVFQYINSIRTAFDDGVGDMIISENSKLGIKLKEYTEKILNILSPNSSFVFHLEVFIKEGQIYFCEIACRPAGALVPRLIKMSHGVDILKEHLRVQVIQDYKPKISKKIITDNYIAGYIIPKKNGKLRKNCDEIPYEFIKYQRNYCKEGTTYYPNNVGDRHIEVIITANTQKELYERINLVKDFVKHNSDWVLEHTT